MKNDTPDLILELGHSWPDLNYHGFHVAAADAVAMDAPDYIPCGSTLPTSCGTERMSSAMFRDFGSPEVMVEVDS